MSRSVLIPTIISLLLTTFSQQKATSAPLAKEPTNSCVHVGRLISVQGKVELKRHAWSNYHQASVGVALCQGDRLRLAKAARAIVQCTDANQNSWNVLTSLSSGAAIGCRPPDEPVYNPTAQPIAPTRDPLASQIPDIITPKNTWLLDNKPTLRWTAVPGTTVYVVRVSGPGVNWVREVNTTSIPYPDNPPLRAGEGYLMVVIAENGETAKTIFSLLDQKRATLVRKAVERITQQNLNEEVKALAIAEVYLGQGLTTEAISLLETLVNKNSKTVAIYQMLGDFFAQVRLLRQAERNYLRAVNLAVTANDIEGQTLAAAKLQEVYTAIGNLEAASYWHKQAQKGYQALFSLKPIAN